MTMLELASAQRRTVPTERSSKFMQNKSVTLTPKAQVAIEYEAFAAQQRLSVTEQPGATP